MSEESTDWLKDIATTETDMQMYIEKLKERTQFYKDESTYRTCYNPY